MGEKITVGPIYLDIPILAAYKFAISDNAKFVVNAGPYMAMVWVVRLNGMTLILETI